MAATAVTEILTWVVVALMFVNVGQWHMLSCQRKTITDLRDVLTGRKEQV